MSKRARRTGLELDDTTYFRHAVTALAPARLDWVARKAGYQPPRRPGESFRHLDLGCGYGTTSLLLAAALPEGEFVGLDMVRAHITDANRFAKRAKLPNVRFLTGSFDDALSGRLGDLGQFDYVTAHGVLAWVPEAVRAELFELIARTLAPGGLLYLGYNCAIGWASALPLQSFVWTHAERAGKGDPPARASAAFAAARELHATGAQGLYGVPLAQYLLEQSKVYPPAYLVHEYLAPDWRPLGAAEVLDKTMAVGIERLGSTRLMENRDDFVLRRAQRDLLRKVRDPVLAEVMRDVCRAPTFRNDVFGRGLRKLPANTARARQLDQTMVLTCALDQVTYETRTDAGVLRFDNAVTRAVAEAAATGPISLRAIAKTRGLRPAAVLDGADALLASEQLEPVDPPHAEPPPSIVRVNDLLREAAGTPVQARAQTTALGVARAADAPTLAFLAAGPTAGQRRLRAASLARGIPARVADAADFAKHERAVWRRYGVA